MHVLSTNAQTLAATLCVAALTMIAAAPVRAQFTQSGNTYYTTADHTLNTDISGNEVFVGKNTDFSGVPGTVTLTVATGAVITNNNAPAVNTLFGLNVFGNHRANITGGDVRFAVGLDTSTTNISGGNVDFAVSYDSSTTNISDGIVLQAESYDTGTVNFSGGLAFEAYIGDASTMNISGGNVGAVYGLQSGAVNISGGVLDFATGYDTSTANISGGTLTSGFLLSSTTATANFVGTDLSYAYTGYGDSNPYFTFADYFTVSGTFGGATGTYDLYVSNDSGTANSTPRQFFLNGVTPVVVPEAGTLALVLPALTVGFVVVRRKRGGK